MPAQLKLDGTSADLELKMLRISWPGVGSLLFQAVNVRDTPLTTGVVVVYTTLFIALNVLIDLFYFIIDPRVGAAGGVRH